jgi:hypothetical protein
MERQRTWQRIILLTVLGYEGAGAVVGGSLLVARPDGHYMDMPVALMHGTFRDFLIPGTILFALGLVALGFAATALGKAFRLYSMATFIAVIGFGVVMFLQAPLVGANQPTPLLGVWERINIGLFLVWVIVLATELLARGREQGRRPTLDGLSALAGR